MSNGRAGIGSHKHGISGTPGRNARYKALSLDEDRKEKEYSEKRKKLRPELKSAKVRDLIK